MKKDGLLISILALGAIIFFSCKKDVKHPIKNEENEIITTVKISLIPTNSPTIFATWKDLTPNDDLGRMIDTLKIDSGMVYNGKIELLDETKSPTDTISEQVKKEGDDHLFVYRQVPESPEIITIFRTDKDSKNLPVGLIFTLTALNKGAGKLNIVLRHQPGVKDGTPVPGDDDLNVEIPFVSK